MLVFALISCGGTSTPNEPNEPPKDTGGGEEIVCEHENVISDYAVEPTCTETGLTYGVHCGDCNKVLVSQKVVEALGHKEVKTEDILPTCTKDGYIDGTHCSVCDQVVKAPTISKAKGHTEVAMQDIEPTCQKVGYRGGVECSECGITIRQPSEVGKIGHVEVQNEYKAPTCDEYGINGGSHCKNCNETIVKPGLIEPLGHTEITLSGYLSTCDKTGLSDGKYCTVCKKTTVKQIVIDKEKHREIITPGVLPTCQSEGYTEKRECSVCGEVTLESKKLEKTGHSAVIDKAVEPTCSKTGLTEGSHCSVCNEVIKKQETIAKNNNHVYDGFATVTKAPTTSSSGIGTMKCSACGNTQSITFDKLTTKKLTADDIYSIETDIYNAAYDNRWKIIDGKTSTAGLWSPGGEWFGHKGDILTITLNQEMTITALKIYLTGNATNGTLRVKDSSGKTTYTKGLYIDGGDAYGGSSKAVSLTSGASIKAYTIEIEVTAIKWESPMTFKVAELEITAAANDTRISHTHAYREFIDTARVATCQETGIDLYACFCGHKKEIETGKGDHAFNTLKSAVTASCTENGREVYSCFCGATKTTTIKATGHVYHKLVNYTVMPTATKSGLATVKCNGCGLTEQRVVSPLPIEEINYLRVDQISGGKVTLKLNIYGDKPNYEVRYSESEITEENYSSAKIIEASVSGETLITLTFELDASLDKCYYVAVKPYNGENYGKMATVRVGGNLEVPIDYKDAGVYHGEVLNSFAPIFDNDITTKLGTVFPNSGDTKELYGSNLSPIVDLEYMHHITKVRLYYAESGYEVTVRWSYYPLDFQSENERWMGFKTFNTTSGWNEIEINKDIRYIQVIFKDGQSPYEMEAYGYQCGESDTMAEERRELATIGELIGMCGFVAGGGGHTPIEDVSCVNVLREYHNFGWSYNASLYGGKASFFTSSWNNFDYQYKAFTEAGMNVIPCIQWSLGNGETISYRVDSSNMPVYTGGKLVKSTFWERFNPHTYFVYADNMFALAARYGSTNTQYLFNVASQHCETTPMVGQGTIKWIEMGNEPEGGWNGIHNYLSAYQLAAATSAAYDGHCSTIPVTVAGGYHLGGKNADANIKLAMAGVSGISNEYITAMIHWMKANRPDSYAAFDAFNVHNYMAKTVTLPNGSDVTVGISPEEANIAGTLSQLIAIRDKYYPEKEVWITEFGWDTNQSYATSTSCHAYAEYTGRQVQAMWLTRTYLILSAIGIDKADMYMAHDTGVEEVSVGKYGTCGVIGYEYDENGNQVKVKKDSYYYLYTLKNTLGDYAFDSQIEAYDENVMIYKYKTDEGKTAYAVWCKTSDGTKVANYQLGIDAKSATLVENVYGEIEGVKTHIEADSLGYVTVNVSENPIYIVVD